MTRKGVVSLAAQAGVQVGDVIIKWDQNVIDGPVHLRRMVAQVGIGSSVSVIIFRNGSEFERTVAVVERP